MPRTLTLIGDSIFDNGVYVAAGEADVTAHLNRKLDLLDWTLDMRAVDGAVVDDVGSQLTAKSIERPGTLALSVGGNDALGYLDLLGDPAADKTVASVLTVFNEIKETFRARYTTLLDAILEYKQPLIVCTIYNPKFPEAGVQTLAETGLSFFNDVITEEALARGLPIIDLRRVCSDPAAFANPIEPSEIGGDLITDAIIQLLPD